jgi:hypothetical protein
MRPRSESSAAFVFMPTNDDLSWFAGVLDAEGSFGLRRHTVRKSQVTANAFFGMADRRTVERAKQIAESFYGPLVTHERPPTKKSTRTFFCFNMTRKKELYSFLRAMIPFLRVKRLEALAQYDFLARASKARHIGTEHDFWLCEISRRLKNADRSAHEELLTRVRDDFETRTVDRLWLAGYTDGDGSISMPSGTKTICLSYGSMNLFELECVAERVRILLGGEHKLPQIAEMKSLLSTRPQWRFDVRELSAVTSLLLVIQDNLFTKRSQAQLALFARATNDATKRERAIDLIQGLNHGSVGEDIAQDFLRAQH